MSVPLSNLCDVFQFSQQLQFVIEAVEYDHLSLEVDQLTNILNSRWIRIHNPSENPDQVCRVFYRFLIEHVPQILYYLIVQRFVVTHTVFQNMTLGMTLVWHLYDNLRTHVQQFTHTNITVDLRELRIRVVYYMFSFEVG